MFTASQIVAHLIGDYLLQSDWMANEKTKKIHVALIHALFYCLPFLALGPSWSALIVIVGTHALIDRFRLAKYVVWAKNFIAPRYTIDGPKKTIWADDLAWEPWMMQSRIGDCITLKEQSYVVVFTYNNGPGGRQSGLDLIPATTWHWSWEKCKGTGYYEGRPAWMAVWLLIIADNTLHIVINALALTYL